MSQQGRLEQPDEGILTLSGNTGGPVGPDGAGDIAVEGTGIISVSGNPGTNTLTISSTGATATTFDCDVGSATPAASTLVVAGGTNINTDGATNVVTINLDDDITVNSATTSNAATNITIQDNNITTGGTDANVDLNITAQGTGDLVVNNNVTVASDRLTVFEDQNSPTDIRVSNLDGGASSAAQVRVTSTGAGNCEMLYTYFGGPTFVIGVDASTPNKDFVCAGTGLGSFNIWSADGSSRKVSFETGILLVPATPDTIAYYTTGGELSEIGPLTDGQLVIGATGGAPAAGSITSTGGTISVTPGTNTINLETDGSVATTYSTDSGSAVPSGGTLQVLGGTNMNSAGATNAVTLNLDTTLTGLTSVEVGDLTLSGATIATTAMNNDIILDPDGTGRVETSLLAVNYTPAGNSLTIGGSSFNTDIITGDGGVPNVIEVGVTSQNNIAADGSIIVAARSRDSTGSRDIVQSGDALLRLVNVGFDGTDFAISSEIRAEVDGTPGAGDMPGRLVFLTTPDGSETAIEALRLSQDQSALFSGDVSISGGSLQIDPAAATDSFIQYDESTTPKWRHGNDATDDSWRLSQGSSLGTNDTFIMTSAGERTLPLNPAFLATHSVAQLNVTGNGTLATVNYTTEIFDQNGDYDGTNTFTAPVSGRYQFNASVLLNEMSGFNTSDMRITTSNRVYRSNRLGNGALSIGDDIGYCMSILADMDALDICSVGVLANGIGADTADLPADVNFTTFSGFLAS